MAKSWLVSQPGSPVPNPSSSSTVGTERLLPVRSIPEPLREKGLNTWRHETCLSFKVSKGGQEAGKSTHFYGTTRLDEVFLPRAKPLLNLDQSYAQESGLRDDFWQSRS